MTAERLPTSFSFDTETGDCGGHTLKNVLIQICPVDAVSEKEVKLFLGEDCYGQFLRSFAINDERNIWCRLYNNKWEARPLIMAIIDAGYKWVDSRKKSTIPKMGWTCVQDDKQVYEVYVRNANGCLMTITDDYLKVIGHSMSEATEMVRKQHPDWWPEGGDTKMHIPDSLYNRWYTFGEDDPRYRLFLQYATRDAYSQAMLSKWLDIHGFQGCLTSASNGLMMALNLVYLGINDLSETSRGSNKWSKEKFKKQHPPLGRREQDILEDSLLGGFVYGVAGKVGKKYGRFCHLDYKSSYPYEYMYGLLPVACKDGSPCHVYAKGTEGYERTFANPKGKCIGVLVDFKFRLLPNRMPCLSAESCYNPKTESDFRANRSKKMIVGEVRNKLYTMTLYDEIKRHYEVYDEDIKEVWVSPGKVGEFSEFIKLCFRNKERPELKGTLERSMWKLMMNGGVHGKTITKTHRATVKYPDNVKTTISKDESEPSEPQYCALIGFTAMQNARARLLKHCRLLMDAGYTVHMCDTDSIVVEATEKQVRSVLGDWIVDETLTGDDAIKNLGRFEFETNEDMLKRIYGKRDGVWMYRKEQVRVEFDALNVGGLKEYAEFDTSLGSEELRKSAFKGMHEDVQQTLLPNADMRLGNTIQWTQTQKKWNGNAYELVPVVKTSLIEDIYYKEIDLENVETKLKAKTKPKEKKNVRKERILQSKGDTGVQRENKYRFVLKRNWEVLWNQVVYDRTRRGIYVSVPEHGGYGTRSGDVVGRPVRQSDGQGTMESGTLRMGEGQGKCPAIAGRKSERILSLYLPGKPHQTGDIPGHIELDMVGRVHPFGVQTLGGGTFGRGRVACDHQDGRPRHYPQQGK